MLARFATSTAMLALSAGMASADYTLHILHTNDIHSRIESINRFDSTCNAEGEAEGKCFGGVARIKAAIDAKRAELAGQNVVVLDAGDPFQGSLFYTTYKGAAEAEFMEAIGYDAMAVGNHEFDDGPPKLAEFIANVSFPVVSGNLDLTGEASLKDAVADHVVLEIGGEKIGIVSALATDTVETSSPGPNVVFQDEIDSLAADAAKLEEMGVTKIIALNHVGLPKDLEIAGAVPALDVVIGGHSHTLMQNNDAETPSYPQMVDGTPVAQAYAYSKYVGHLVVTFDDAGNVTSATGNPILLDASVTPDEAVLARIAEMGAPIEEMKNRVVAATTDAVEGVLPFQNTLSTFRVSGAAVVEALENGASQMEEVKGRFPQVAGMSFTVDPSAAPGARISDVMVGGAPIDMDKVYGVVSNNYVRGGGDGYAMFVDAADAYDFGPDLADVTAEYLAANAPYTPYTDGRITVK